MANRKLAIARQNEPKRDEAEIRRRVDKLAEADLQPP